MTKLFDDGEIVEYEYLWEWQAEKGRTNAEKARPVCLAMVVRDGKQGITHLIILPISSTQPRPDQDALAIPALELRRAGLPDFKAGWITVSEYNYDVLERSFYYDPAQKPRGRFSGPFMDQILIRFRRYLREKRGRVDRTK